MPRRSVFLCGTAHIWVFVGTFKEIAPVVYWIRLCQPSHLLSRVPTVQKVGQISVLWQKKGSLVTGWLLTVHNSSTITSEWKHVYKYAYTHSLTHPLYKQMPLVCPVSISWHLYTLQYLPEVVFHCTSTASNICSIFLASLDSGREKEASRHRWLAFSTSLFVSKSML